MLQGHTALFTTAGQMLSELAALDSDSALRRRLQHYAAPDLLLIDEVGYLSYSNRHADMLFELVSRRYLHKSTVVTTNRRFADWGEVFPNAACVVSLVDRLMHRAEVVRIEGDSYRQKEAEERAMQRAAARTRRGAHEGSFSAQAACVRPPAVAASMRPPRRKRTSRDRPLRSRCRRTGRPRRRSPSSNASSCCASNSGSPTARRSNAPGALNSCPDRAPPDSIPTQPF